MQILIDIPEDVIESAKSNPNYYPTYHFEKIWKAIANGTPLPKTGHWIEKDGFDGDVYYDCSECGESWTTIEGTPWDNEFKYCPSCGCRMVEPQESERTL